MAAAGLRSKVALVAWEEVNARGGDAMILEPIGYASERAAGKAGPFVDNSETRCRVAQQPSGKLRGDCKLPSKRISLGTQRQRRRCMQGGGDNGGKSGSDAPQTDYHGIGAQTGLSRGLQIALGVESVKGIAFRFPDTEGDRRADGREQVRDMGRYANPLREPPLPGTGDEHRKVEEETLASLTGGGDLVGSRLFELRIRKPLHQFSGFEQDRNEFGVPLDTWGLIFDPAQPRRDRG